MAPEVMLLHGFTHTGGSWDLVVAALGERYRAITPDIRGHGGAGDAQPVTLQAVLGDLSDVAPEHFVLVGYSMGGRVALHLALAQPERIDRLILIGASPGLADASERAERRGADERLADEIEHLSIEEFAREWARSPILAGLGDEALDRVHADRVRNTPHGLARALRGLGTGALPSLWDRLGELSIPVTLVVGERDEKFIGIARRMVRLIPAARVIVVPGTGHAVHLEAPHRVADILGGSE